MQDSSDATVVSSAHVAAATANAATSRADAIATDGNTSKTTSAQVTAEADATNAASATATSEVTNSADAAATSEATNSSDAGATSDATNGADAAATSDATNGACAAATNPTDVEIGTDADAPEAAFCRAAVQVCVDFPGSGEGSQAPPAEDGAAPGALHLVAPVHLLDPRSALGTPLPHQWVGGEPRL